MCCAEVGGMLWGRGEERKEVLGGDSVVRRVYRLRSVAVVPIYSGREDVKAIVRAFEWRSRLWYFVEGSKVEWRENRRIGARPGSAILD